MFLTFLPARFILTNSTISRAYNIKLKNIQFKVKYVDIVQMTNVFELIR